MLGGGGSGPGGCISDLNAFLFLSLVGAKS